jgi:hypothetical protein
VLATFTDNVEPVSASQGVDHGEREVDGRQTARRRKNGAIGCFPLAVRSGDTATTPFDSEAQRVLSHNLDTRL